jgi:hypothetical protein
MLAVIIVTYLKLKDEGGWWSLPFHFFFHSDGKVSNISCLPMQFA